MKLLAALTLMGSTNRWINKFDLSGETALGYEAKGEEIVRVPLKEPVFIRPFYDKKLQVYRHNIT